ncbi:serine hydrolase domain-containing protein [Flavihumibacter profundi]|uniref:serine hydrolase domain-containing protein n=1 Tax=Flavihumibacter profundi TaxID=2716883 RepID=UPI001CC7106E|nr:serine hydrolase domain-containing protein [Flavihumibacter profundi]MBZ5859312.1 beta-lactamase family protein [Flavihumibacter profundi]
MKNILALLLLCVCTAGFTQTKSAKNSPALGEASPESVGMSGERLARMDNIFQQSINNKEVPGVAAIVVRNGKIVYYKAFGMADNPGNKTLKKDDIFRIASMSKAITSTAVMMLWEEGKFQLDDPISKYIPEFKNPTLIKSFSFKDTSYTTEPAKSEITIRQLLSHTSGLGYGEIDGDERFKAIYKKAGITDLFTTEPVKIGESVKKLARLPLHHNPGEKFTYSEGLDVLGYFIEVVSGMGFDEFLRKKIFEPLGMSDSYFYLPENKYQRMVAVQRPGKDGQWERFPVTFYDPEYPVKGAKSFFSGGAGLSSTAKDYATFLQMYLNGGELGGKRILSRSTVKTILSNQVDTLFGGEKGDSFFGLAYSVLTANGEGRGGAGSAGTFTWGGYFNTNYFADPKEKIIGVIMKQTQDTKGDNLNNLFRQMIYQSLDD